MPLFWGVPLRLAAGVLLWRGEAVQCAAGVFSWVGGVLKLAGGLPERRGGIKIPAGFFLRLMDHHTYHAPRLDIPYNFPKKIISEHLFNFNHPSTSE